MIEKSQISQNNQQNSNSLLTASIAALQRKNPSITAELDDIGNHDAWHAITHPSFSSDNWTCYDKVER